MTASESAAKVAQDLGRAGYAGLFLAGDLSSADSIWRAGANRQSLEEVVLGGRYGDLERVLASEILYRNEAGYPPDGWRETLAGVYARALAITGTGDRPIVLSGNEWGFLYHAVESGARDDGPLGAHLVDCGPVALGHLVPLLDDPASIFYEGSQDATLGNGLRYRVKDAAAYYIGRLTGISVAFREEPQERDAEIERLKAAVASPLTESADISERQSGLQGLARRHLWMHFTRMGAYAEHEVPIIVRGDGCYVYDDHGRRYLDGLSSLYCVNVGHGRDELAEAAAAQARKLAFYPTWSAAHPAAIELAARIAALAPAGLDRVFFTSGGSEAVESAWKLVRAYHGLCGQPTRTKLIAREVAYHGTSMGALAATGVTSLRQPFEPLTPGGCHVANTNSYRWPEDRDPLWAADAIEHRILFEGPQTVAAVILEPVQNAGGCFVPQEGYFQRVREICDRHGVLLISDEVICSWGRLGHDFGCDRFGYVPDIITTAKGMASAYAPIGAMIVADRVAEPFMHGSAMFAHGFTFGGHPVSAAVALANLEILRREDLCRRVREREAAFRAMLDGLRDLEIVGDVRGAGYFQAIELVKDRETKERFSTEESASLVRGFLSAELFARGLICRADDRGDPVIQLAPPLIAGPEQFAEIEAILRSVLAAAWERIARS